MCADSQNQDDNIDFNEENPRDFEAMMKRWGIELPDETAKPLGTDRLIAKWCESKFSRPMAAIKELKEGKRHVEASAALFGYCYAVLEPSFFGMPLEQCLALSLEQVERSRIRVDSGLVQDKCELEIDEHQAIICRDLIDFANGYATGQSSYTEGQHNEVVSSYVDLLLAAANSLVFFSSGNREYDPYLNGHLERIFEIIRQSKVQRAERFSTSNFNNDGRDLSGDVEGFLACLGCAVICYSFAHMNSELRPDYERDYENAFKAFVHGAEYMLKTGYDIDFFKELFTSEPEKGTDGPSIYWKIIGVWEQLKENTERVKNWRELRVCLTGLEDIMYREGHDTDIGLYPTDEPGFVYLPRQMSFCEGRLSQKEVLELIDQRKRNQHEVRLQNDFFEGLWQYLEEDTRDNIIRAEHRWYDNPTGESRKAAFIDYSNALEIELRYIIFASPDTKACVTRLIRNSSKKEPDRGLPRLTSKKAASLYLSDISKLLCHIRGDKTDAALLPIVLAISNLPLLRNVKPEKQPKSLFTNEDFTQDLSDVYQIRNIAAHSLCNRPVLSRLNELRRKILGMGCEGHLIRLAELKRLMRDSKQSQ